MGTEPLTTPRARRTAERLLAAALDLFARNGYEATTVAQVAAAAGVTEMTFYRHFGSKEALLVDDPYDPLIAEAVGRQPRSLPALLRAARGLREAWRGMPIEDAEPVRARVRIAAGTPSLRGVMRANTARTEEAVAGRLVADGCDPTTAAVAAAAVLAALMTALLRWAEEDGTDLGAAVESALDVLEVHDA